MAYEVVCKSIVLILLLKIAKYRIILRLECYAIDLKFAILAALWIAHAVNLLEVA